MPAKTVICISSEVATAARFSGGKLGPCTVFENDENGYEELGAWLARQRRDPVHILVDVVEEDYRFDLMPHTLGIGADRAEMVGRKLRQMYRNSAYCAAWLQGRDSGKRRDDRYLFTALTNPDVVVNWLNVLAAQKLPFAGLYLLPMVLHSAVARLGLKSTNLLLVTQQDSGTRLTFFRDQMLRISRLARVEGETPEARTRALVDEIANTRLYLHALRVMTLDEQMAVAVLDADGTLAEFTERLRAEAQNLTAGRITAAEITSKLGVPAPDLANTPMALFLQLLGPLNPPGNLAPKPLTEGYRHYVARRSLYAVAATAALGLTGWAGANVFQAFELTQQAQIAAQQTARQQQLYVDVTRQFPAAPASADNLRLTVETAQRFMDRRRNPDLMLRLVSSALEQHPAIALRSFQWRHSNQDIDAMRDGANAETNPAPQPQPAPGGQAGSAPAPRRQSALVDAEIRPFSGDYRAAITEINNFAARLREQPGVADVRIVTLPLNINPASSLSGSTLDKPTESTTAPFKLVVSLKPGT